MARRRSALLAITVFACDSNQGGHDRTAEDAPAGDARAPAAPEPGAGDPADARFQPTTEGPSTAKEEARPRDRGADPTLPEEADITALQPKRLEDYLGHHVLVGHGARLRATPDPAVPATVLKLRERARGVTPAITMEVVGHEGDFLALRPSLESEGCTPTVPALRDFDVRLWVRPEDLATAVAVPTRVTFEDGTAVSLWPGAPVSTDEGDPEGVVRVDVGGTALSLPIELMRLGPVFRPKPPPKVEGESNVLSKKGPPLRLDGQAVEEAGLLLVDQHPAVTMTAAGAAIGTVWTRCAALDVTVDPDRKVMLRSFATSRLFPHPAEDPFVHATRWAVSTGATVYLRGGETTGTVLRQREFIARPRRDGKTRECFWVSFVENRALAVPGASEGKKSKPRANRSRLELCFDGAYVTEVPAVPPDPGLRIGILGAPPSTKALEAAVAEAFEDEGLFAEMDREELDEIFGVGELAATAAEIGKGEKDDADPADEEAGVAARPEGEGEPGAAGEESIDESAGGRADPGEPSDER